MFFCYILNIVCEKKYAVFFCNASDYVSMHFSTFYVLKDKY